MSKTLIIALLIVVLTGSGIAFAGYSPATEMFGLNAEIDTTEPEDIGTDENEHGTEEEPLSVSEAVHNALSGETISPKYLDTTFGEKVSARAQDKGIDLGELVSEAAREAAKAQNEGNNDSNNGNERSEVAKAVHEALTGEEEEEEELTPEDGKDFGQAVASQARDNGAEFGQSVSEAAREANNSTGAGNDNNRGNSGNRGRPEGVGKPGNPGN